MECRECKIRQDDYMDLCKEHDKQAKEIARLKKKIKQWVCGVCEINEESECDHKTCEVFKTLKERQGE